ncbi:MAG: hypothetical protein KF830_01410 [Planctomycetes bacterium]|nr:hypothetical protein [Planctomycetota bacterium]
MPICAVRCVAAATLVSLGFVVAVPGQGCSAGGTFWKRDNLPVVPSGATAAAVVRGMCEGESAGVVFEMPAGMPPQKVLQVVAPWGEAFSGVPGFQALLDVEVYDGVAFSGSLPVMPSPTFRLSNTGSSMQVQTHGLNTLDVSGYDIVVGLAPATGTPPVRRFAICFRIDLNAHPTGSCASGYPANFFTDAQTTLFPCATPPRTALMEIQGQGWRDASQTTVSGFPICPAYYNGTWAIRCCTQDAFPAYYTTFAPGCPSTLGVSSLVPATLPRIGTTMLVIVDKLPYNIALMLMGFTSSAPYPLDVTPFGLPGCFLRVSMEFDYLLLGGGTTAVHSLALPFDNTLLGLILHQQAFVLDPPLNAFGGALSNAATLQIGI